MNRRDLPRSLAVAIPVRGSGLGTRHYRRTHMMMERRDFVRTLGAAALGPALLPLAPSPYPRTPLRKLDHVGLQLYTVRDEMKKDVEATIARVAATGYTEVEFAGYFGKGPAEVRAMLDRHGITAPSAHIGSIAPDAWREALDAAHVIGHSYVVVPWIPVEARTGVDGDNKIAAVGAGKIDWKRIFAKEQQAGIKHFFVEHDQPADAFASIKASCEYLKRLEF